LGGLFDKFKQGLRRTQELVLAPMGRLLGLRHLDEGELEELEDLLLQADLGLKAVDQLMARLRTEMKAGDIDPKALLKEELLRLLRQQPPQPFQADGTQVVLLVGVNGVGKTTTLGKLAAHLKGRGEGLLVVAGDTFRAAAIAFDGATSAQAKGTPWVLIDTAGRLHTKDHLMKELDKIRRSLQKVIPEAPHRVLLVLDATTGQNGLAQAEAFVQAAGVTDLVLTKLDGSAKGGVVVPILDRLGLPIAFVGVGEGLEDLIPFDPEAFVDGLLDA
jgi:fused signal recognition particle receptor